MIVSCADCRFGLPAVLAVCATVVATAPATVRGQIIWQEERNGKLITCSRSGLGGWYTNCGVDGFYSQIFVGTVRSVAPVKAGGFDEYRLVLEPEEVFHGEVPDRFVVTTNEGDCLPEIHAGDRWLFYIYTDKERGPLLEYGHPSETIDAAQDDLARLRELEDMSGSGLVKGALDFGWFQGGEERGVSLVNREIAATSKANGTIHRARTDGEGKFEFEPLPMGDYELEIRNIPGLWTADDGKITVEAGSCKDFSIHLSPDGLMSGHLRTADGKPVGPIWVYAIDSEDQGRFTSTFSDSNGYFAFRGVRAGRYWIGVSSANAKDSSESDIRIYAPGVSSKEEAAVVELGYAEHRENLDITIPIAGPYH